MILLLDAEPRITTLPIHDSFIVRRGAEPILKSAMGQAFLEIIGSDAVIDKDETVFESPHEEVESYSGLADDVH